MYLTGSLGGSSMRSSVDRAEAGDVADRADALAVGLPDGLDARPDAQALEALRDDVGQRSIGALELDQDEGERRWRGVQALDGLVHDGDGSDGARARHRHPFAALRAGGFRVAERRDDPAPPRHALSPATPRILHTPPKPPQCSTPRP